MDKVVYQEKNFDMFFLKSQISCTHCAVGILIKDCKECRRCIYCTKYFSLENEIQKKSFRHGLSHFNKQILINKDNVFTLKPNVTNRLPLSKREELDDEINNLNDLFWEGYNKDKEI